MNKKVMAMFEKAEDEYNELISKKSIIEVCSAQLVDFLSYYGFTYNDLPFNRMTSQKSRW